MVKKIVIILAEGFEEIEAITPIDVWRRAGLNVVIVGLTGKSVKGSHGITVEADLVLKDLKETPDVIFLPGGLPGSTNLADSPAVIELVQKMNREKKLVTAICASPALSLEKSGILAGKRATCYPGFEKNFSSSVTFTTDRVVVDGDIITSRGPGSAAEFALTVVERLVSKEKAQSLKEVLLVKA
jgi:4-methyl-5(b-hydroxyethyl)-thiazole monophosphate biosynthesis